MFYLYTILVPTLILVLGYLLRKPKPKSFRDYVVLISRIIPFIIAYTILIYYLEMNDIITTGWVAYTLLFFLFPVAIVVLIILFYFKIWGRPLVKDKDLPN